MTAEIDLQIASEAPTLPTAAQFQHWVEAALDNSASLKTIPNTSPVELSIRIVDREEIQGLNRQYRQQDKATNVLAFTAELPAGIDLPLLGDLVICADVVAAEAAEQAKTHAAHWAHMVIHGTLHLLGYDHITNDEAAVMEALESHILQQLGYGCPYQ
ncbi:MAG: rRNA maturation RNase YbeY [Cellvibrionaceae bacterium]|nr:rRNA maturation RNase YbeY [Cellvibrionaceae bacterium]